MMLKQNKRRASRNGERDLPSSRPAGVHRSAGLKLLPLSQSYTDPVRVGVSAAGARVGIYTPTGMSHSQGITLATAALSPPNPPRGPVSPACYLSVF